MYTYRENKEFVMLFEVSVDDEGDRDDDADAGDDSNCNRYCKIYLNTRKLNILISQWLICLCCGL
jgi:hypothetical protein